MKVRQSSWTSAGGWRAKEDDAGNPQLILAFGSGEVIGTEGEALRDRFPEATILGCSTAGEIHGERVLDDSLVVTAVELEHSSIAAECIEIDTADSSLELGRKLAGSIPADGLRHCFVLASGLKINGSELVRGLTSELPAGVIVTGGLAGDGDRFESTRLLWNGVSIDEGAAVVGFYGDRLKVGCGSLGGWDPFGPKRRVTRSEGNVLYELDGQSALEIYRRYLGEYAAGLPGTGLLFPLSIQTGDEEPLVRTLLSIDPEGGSMTFAGDVPEGGVARMMKANFDRLVDGAIGAARTSHTALGTESPDLAILISCVGRKMVLRQRIEEEVEGVRSVLGEKPVMTGFYSYGEISPFTPESPCALHNQTMTITTLAEN